jgi:hypothetical protein
MFTSSKYILLFSLLLSTACAQANSTNEETVDKPAVMAEEAITDTFSSTISTEPAPAAEDSNSVVPTTKADNSNQIAVTKPPQRIATPPKEAVTAPTEPNAPSHETWDNLLRKHVTADGKVNYTGFQKDMAKLQAYLDLLAKQLPESSWGRNERLAYWINAYNAFTVKLIVDNYPVNSIRDIYDGNPWDVKWIELEGNTFSLNQIEHEIIRKRFDEPRIHFAVNCAARSCPPLVNRAFTAEHLNAMLKKATQQFLTNPAYNKIDTKQAELSKIFDWYGSDFGDINQFLEQYVPSQISPETPIKFMEYDWVLNRQ